MFIFASYDNSDDTLIKDAGTNFKDFCLDVSFKRMRWEASHLNFVCIAKIQLFSDSCNFLFLLDIKYFHFISLILDIYNELLSFFPDPIIFIFSWILKLIGNFGLNPNFFSSSVLEYTTMKLDEQFYSIS